MNLKTNISHVTLLCLAKKHDAGANLLVNEEKRKLLLTTEGMMELENHHFTTITVITYSGRNQQWMRSLDASVLGSRLCPQSQTSSHRFFINHKGKKGAFTVRTPGRCQLNQVIQLNITKNGTS